MSDFELVKHQDTLETQKRYYNRKIHIEKKMEEIPRQYDGDICRYKKYCSSTGQIVGTEAMLDYLYISLIEQKVKKTTWERRLAAIRKYLSVIHRIEFKAEAKVAYELSAMRKMYREDRYAHLLQVRGKSAVDKKELMDILNSLPIRAKAICLVNLVTANRPNEMVRLRVRDFDLKNRSVHVYLKKQKRWHIKRLTPEVINAIELYIREYYLQPNDYFVGRAYKNGRYESTAISEIGYGKALQRWTGLTGYNFRKSQVVAMHAAGADLPTIAQQTGHQSIETLMQHYLTVSKITIDKYL
ncbi:tyrosine-type recombinase/integrase [Planococcus sp. S3-L1]|uniref:tyrosine-type recombinase/integrase n=1 Tax=Planococcus sp. S3-L1 TaxID=3046200 RepID=UPI0024B8949D|nr:tyrosine-type recombinase/integrase [Planococcus sp. S3-L1]MDJ0333440.1 tyrosine-type recombinase/integrase [Planococcus sp. S3-L1]